MAIGIAGILTASALNAAPMTAADLPGQGDRPPVEAPHFPSRLHAFVWRNWQLVPAERMAQVAGCTRDDITRIGRAMGLSGPPRVTADQQRRSYVTVIRRNWHLLPYEQLLSLLEWTPEQLAYTLREDDFLFIKLGSVKPRCEPVRYQPSDGTTRQRERAIAALVRQRFPDGIGVPQDPLFAFVSRLSRADGGSGAPPPDSPQNSGAGGAGASLSPRFCYSYFALYGDPLLEKDADPFPDGYLARMAASGVEGVWLQAVLYKLAPFHWQPELSARYEERLRTLRALVSRARKHGIGIYLYLNEPRAMPLAFYEGRTQMQGAPEGDHAALCTSDPEVQRYLTGAVASICRAVPDLAGFFTITASENLSNCWSHGQGAKCPRCGKRTPGEVIAEANGLFREGIRQAGSKAQLIAWDWGWRDEWAEDAINRLPADVALMSVSEWSLPLQRGGVESVVGEYSISAVGPGPRAQKHWEIARARGLKTIAKIQAGCTWELSAVPYIPAVANVAQHAANLRGSGVGGLMLGWTLGGYPSPNLEVVAEMGRGDQVTPDEAMARVARRRFGAEAAPAMVQAWRDFSAAFSEFPFHIRTVYSAPLQMGPANPLWGAPTGWRASMVGLPYDDLDAWRAVYPPEAFAGQLEKVAGGFERALETLKKGLPAGILISSRPEGQAVFMELDVAEACAIHFRSVANQTRFVHARRALEAAKSAEEARPLLAALRAALESETALAARLYVLQSRDSRLGFEATNHYFYTPLDLAEKVLNCRDLLERWLPEQEKKWG